MAPTDEGTPAPRREGTGSPSPIGSLVNWDFLEFLFAIEYDIVLALGKLRRAGFVRHPDTVEGFIRRFDEYRCARIIAAV